MSSSSSYNHQDFIKNYLIPSITKNKTCSICLNNKISNPSLIPICLHAYCTDCILKWSDFKRVCPLCKAKFSSLFVEIDVESLSYRTLHLSKDVKGSSSNVGGGLRFRRMGLMAQRRQTFFFFFFNLQSLDQMRSNLKTRRIRSNYNRIYQMHPYSIL